MNALCPPRRQNARIPSDQRPPHRRSRGSAACDRFGLPTPRWIATWTAGRGPGIGVALGRFEVRGDSVGDSDIEWKDIFAEARTGDEDLEHTVKLTYSCYLEFQNYDEEKYLSVAFRELDRPSPFV